MCDAVLVACHPDPVAPHPMRVYRMHPHSQDPALLLDPAHQWTDPWGGADHGPCDKCTGRGRIEHICWSCALTGARADCPACAGAVRWRARCPVCHGDGEIDARPRRGVSVFPTLEGLYHYMIGHDADLDGCLIVELEGERAPDVDFDADEGALLVIPKRIEHVVAVDPALVERVRRSSAVDGELAPGYHGAADDEPVPRTTS